LYVSTYEIPGVKASEQSIFNVHLLGHGLEGVGSNPRKDVDGQGDEGDDVSGPVVLGIFSGKLERELSGAGVDLMNHVWP
jgi:hypothetical protein